MAIWAHFHDVDPEFTEFAAHRGQFLGLADSSGIGAQFITIYIVQIHELFALAGRAVALGPLPVKLGGLK
jgi:hypothetical protein